MRCLQLCRIAVLGLGCFLGSTSAWKAHGAEPARNPREPFVVHEWGTFSTFSGSDGAFLKFNPDDRDLPEFVHTIHRYIKGGLPDVLVSLETPVTYFYSDRERTASVGVNFPKGRITNWYPQASRPPMERLTWDNLRIAPSTAAEVADESRKGRYFAARATDASMVSTTSNQGQMEQEKFLFYRGVADFAMPFTVRALGEGAFRVTNGCADAVPGFFLVRVDAGKVFFKSFGSLAHGAQVTSQESTVASTPEKLGDAMAKMLSAQGLYEKEARAMVKTWKSDWFGEDGTRVLYLVPESLTNEFLPLKIDPKPDRLVRVMVGRHDLLPPERERQVEALVKRLNDSSNAESRAADEVLNKMGRYRWAAQTAAVARLKLPDETRRRLQR